MPIACYVIKVLRSLITDINNTYLSDNTITACMAVCGLEDSMRENIALHCALFITPSL